jgi:hypothetical protein
MLAKSSDDFNQEPEKELKKVEAKQPSIVA